jgi:3-oxoacyl-[acyl-carrier-protein] synthase-3
MIVSKVKSVKIVGTGNYFPKDILTNHDLEKMVDTSDEWITARTGIKERHIAKDDESTGDMAIEAAKKALKDAKLKPKDLELILVATITPDMFFPSTACLIQAKLGAKKAAIFDIAAACTGYIYGMSIASSMIKCGDFNNCLLIGAEKLTSITDWEDRNTCVLFGDGAGASVLKPTEENKRGLISSYLGGDGNLGYLLHLPAGGSRNPASHETIEKGLHYVKMKGSELFKIAVKKMTEASQVALEKVGLGCKDVDLLVPHQANVRIIKAVAKRLGLAEEKVYLNIEKYGNMSSASTATALNEAVESGRVKKGDIIVLTAFGGGLTWGAAVIKW